MPRVLLPGVRRVLLHRYIAMGTDVLVTNFEMLQAALDSGRLRFRNTAVLCANAERLPQRHLQSLLHAPAFADAGPRLLCYERRNLGHDAVLGALRIAPPSGIAGLW